MQNRSNDNAPAGDRGRDTHLVVNTVEASRYTGLAAATLEKLRCNGGGPPFISYSRRAVRYRVADLDDWMAAHTVGNTSQRRAA